MIWEFKEHLSRLVCEALSLLLRYIQSLLSLRGVVLFGSAAVLFPFSSKGMGTGVELP
jgi:hypothetical protein